MTNSTTSTRIAQASIANQLDREFDSFKTARHALVYDPTVDDVEHLLSGLAPEVVPVACVNVEQARSVVAQLLCSPVLKTLHILAHGASGEVRFGGATLNEDDFLVSGADQIAASRENLKSIHLWSCNTASGERGQQFVQRISENAMSNVFASTQLIGNPTKGGTWGLDVATSPKQMMPFSQQARDAFSGVLAIGNLSNFSVSEQVSAILDSDVTISNIATSSYLLVSLDSYDSTFDQFGFSLPTSTTSADALYVSGGSIFRYVDGTINDVEVATFTGGSGADLKITFTADADDTIATEIAQAIEYEYTGDNPSDPSRTLSLAQYDSADQLIDTEITATFDVVAVNDEPTVTLDADGSNANNTATFTEVDGADDGSAAVSFVTSGTSLADVDSADLATLTVSLTDASVDAGDQLVLGGTTIALDDTTSNIGEVTYGGTVFGYEVTSDTTNTSVTFTSLASSGGAASAAAKADYEALLDALQFNNTSDTLTDGSREFSVVANDGTDDSAAATFTVTMTATDDTPVAANDTGSVDEDATLTVAAGSGVLANDNDPDSAETVSAIEFNSTSGTVGAALSGTYGSLTIESDGSYSYTADQSAADALDAGDTVTDVFTYTVSDGNATDTGTLTITVTGTNDTPTVSSAITSTANEGAVSQTLNLLDGASDVDDSASLSVTSVTYEVAGAATGNSGADVPAGLSLTGSTLTVDPTDAAFDDLAAGATREIVVSYNVDDGTATVAQTATITITGTNDEPTVTLDADGSNANNTATFTEVDGTDDGSAAVSFVTSGTSLADVDSADLATLTVSLTDASVEVGDQLVLGGTTIALDDTSSNTGEVTYGSTVFEYEFTSDGTDTSVTFTSLASSSDAASAAAKADYEALLDALQFNNTSDTLTDGSRAFSVVANDGTDDSAAAKFTVEMVAFNEAPIVALDADSETTNKEAVFSVDTRDEPLTGVSFTNSSRFLSDLDSPELASLTVSVARESLESGDELLFGTTEIDLDNPSALEGEVTYDETVFTYTVDVSDNNIEVSFAGQSEDGEIAPLVAKEQYEALLDDLVFSNSGDQFTDRSTRAFNVTVNDGVNDSNTATLSVLMDRLQDDVLIATVEDSRLGGLGGDDALVASEVDSELLGAQGDDYIQGGSGNDTIEGNAGDDIATGGDGDDTYKFDLGEGDFDYQDIFIGGSGQDTVLFERDLSSYQIGLVADEKRDWLNDLIVTESSLFRGVDASEGFEQDQPVFFIQKIDPDTPGELYQSGYIQAEFLQFEDVTLTFDATGSQAIEPANADDLVNLQAIARQSAEWLSLNMLGGSGADRLISGFGDDLLTGAAGDDTLISSQGSDRLLGGDGDDLLVVLGTDSESEGSRSVTLNGGDGQDTFLLKSVAGDTALRVVIEDFVVGEDVVDFEGIFVQDQGSGETNPATLNDLLGAEALVISDEQLTVDFSQFVNAQGDELDQLNLEINTSDTLVSPAEDVLSSVFGDGGLADERLSGNWWDTLLADAEIST